MRLSAPISRGDISDQDLSSPGLKNDCAILDLLLHRVFRMSGPGEITRLLAEWSGGNQAALDHLLPVVYDELRRIASNYMRDERPGHLLQTTALVHEAYMRLIDQQHVNYRSRTQFFAIAAQVMRHILVDYARGRDRAKRGDGMAPLA